MKKLLLLLGFFLSLSQSKAQTVDTLHAYVSGYGGGSGYLIDTVYREFGNACDGNGNPTGPGIIVAIIDSCSGEPWNNLNVDHGNWNLFCTYPVCSSDYYICRQRAENYFIYSFYDTTGFTSLHEWMRDSVPNGDFILIYSWTTYSYSNGPAALDSLMQELGCSAWPPTDNVPFAYFVKKGETLVMNYFVHGLNSGDNVFIDTTFALGSNCPVGISEIDKANDVLIIYPNPASDNFIININGELKIYDAWGRTAIEQTIINRPSSIINCKNLSKGIYFVKVRDGMKIYTKKLVIE